MKKLTLIIILFFLASTAQAAMVKRGYQTRRSTNPIVARKMILDKDVTGTATFAASNTLVVTMNKPEQTATYKVFITGDTAETFAITAKSTTQFTITSNNAGSTANIDWLIKK